MSSLKGDLKEIRKLEETLFLDLFESAKERHRLGRVRPCKQQRSKPDEYMLSFNQHLSRFRERYDHGE